MRDKFKKSLLALGTVATVVAPIAAIVSCGDSNDSSSPKAAQNILSGQLEKANVKLGAGNTADYNKDVSSNTAEAAGIMKYLKVDGKALAKGAKSQTVSVYGGKVLKLDDYKTVFETLLPVGLDKTKQSDNWTKFVTEVAPAKEGTDTAKQDAFIKEQKAFFEKDFFPESESGYKKTGKRTAIFRSLADKSYIQFMWARFRADNENSSAADLKKNLLSFIFDINQNTNQRTFTVAGVTGAGFGLDEYHFLRAGFDEFVNLLKAYSVKPDLSKGYGTVSKEDFAKEVKSGDNYITYGNASLKKFVSDALDDWTTNIYWGQDRKDATKQQQEYDNWYDYEVDFVKKLISAMMAVAGSDLKDKINYWMQPYRYFAANPLYQHAAPTSIYNSVPAVKTMNTGANLADYVNSSLKADLLMGSMSKAKRDLKALYDHLWKNYSPTFNDAYKRDGGYIQHNVMPFQSHYGGITLETTLDIQNQLKGTSLDLFKMFGGMQNVFSAIKNTYMPLYFRGSIAETTNGRFLGTTNGGNGLKRGIEILSTIHKLLEFSDDNQLKADITQFVRTQVKQLLDDHNGGSTTDFKTIDEYLTKNVWGPYGPLGGAKSVDFKAMFDGVDLGNLNSAKYDAYKRIGDGNGKRQIFSNDILNINHFNKDTGEQEWQIDSRFHDTRVGLYEAQTAENQQGFYMGDGMYTIKTKQDPNMYTSAYWASVDPYHLAGTVSYTLSEIPDPDVYYVPGFSVKDEADLKKATPKDSTGQPIDDINIVVPTTWDLDGNTVTVATDKNQLRRPNEWISAKTSAWNTIVNGAKTDATGPGFTGGTKMNGITNTMNQMKSWDQRVSTERSVINIDGMMVVVGHSDNQTHDQNLTIDNRWEKDVTTSDASVGYSQGTDPSVYQYNGANNEKISYKLLDGMTATTDDVIVDYDSGAKTFADKHAAKWWRQEADYKSGSVPVDKLEGIHHQLNVDMSKRKTFSYVVAPNMDAAGINAKVKAANINIIRNDEYAQIISYEKDGKQYLSANIFQNNNFTTTVKWIDPNAPMILTSSEPTSMMFQRDENFDAKTWKPGDQLTKKQVGFQMVAQSALHDGTKDRVGFGKTIEGIKTPMDNYLMGMEQDYPHYWTDKEEQFQNGEYTDDLKMTDDEFWRQHSKAYPSFAKDSLEEVGKYFFRPDQLDLYPDSSFQMQDEFRIHLQFNGYKPEDEN